MIKQKQRPVLISKILSWITSRIYIFLFLIVERLTLKHADLLGRSLGGLLFYLSSSRRKIVEENVQILKSWAAKRNLKNLFLDQDNRTLAKKIYQSNAGNLFYSLSLMNKPVNIIKKHIKVNGLGLFEKARRNNKGVLVLFSHSGPWELITALPKLEPSILKMDDFAVMFRPLNNYFMNEWYLKKRKRFGARLYSREDGFLKIIRHLKNGSFLNAAFDIRMHEGEKIELFDKPASTSKIPYALYKATDASVVTVDFVRSCDLSWEDRASL